MHCTAGPSEAVARQGTRSTPYAPLRGAPCRAGGEVVVVPKVLIPDCCDLTAEQTRRGGRPPTPEREGSAHRRVEHGFGEALLQVYPPVAACALLGLYR